MQRVEPVFILVIVVIVKPAVYHAQRSGGRFGYLVIVGNQDNGDSIFGI